MNGEPTPIEVFQHARVVMGIILGLGITRLLSGLARFVQHPNRQKIDAVHIGWVFTLLLMLIHFWWWEFDLIELRHWNFEIYFFLITYSILLFLMCSLLFPDDLHDYSGYQGFFISRRKWFFGLLGATILFDVADTIIKGTAHYAIFAYEYHFRIPIYMVLCAVAIWTPNRRFHQLFVVGSLAYEVSWILRLFNRLS